jgi:16S rRNA processing protein RimM
VRAPFGVRGELIVDSLTDFPQRFRRAATLWAAGVSYTVRSARPHRGALLLELSGIDSRDQAESLSGLLLEVPEDELPALAEGEYYRFQIVGMDVVDRAGQPLGRIEDVLDTGANDVYVVRNAEGDLLLPATDAVVKEVDVAGRRMVVELMAGLERKPHPQPRRRTRRPSRQTPQSSQR